MEKSRRSSNDKTPLSLPNAPAAAGESAARGRAILRPVKRPGRVFSQRTRPVKRRAGPAV